MNEYLVKVRHIVPSLVYITIGTFAFMAFARWASFQFELFELKEMVWTLWIPMVLPWIPITIWLRPKLRILIRKKDSDRMRSGFQMIAWVTIGASLFISQEYLNTALGEMAALNTVEELADHPKAQFFTIKNFVVLPKFGTAANDIRVTGKYGEHVDINLFFTLPISKDSVDHLPKYQCWYGVKFHKQISSHESDEVKEEKYKAFYQQCVNKMIHYPYHDLQYFRRIPKSDDKDGFLKAIQNFVQITPPPQTIILEPKTNDFNERSGSKLFWSFGSMGIGTAFFLLCLIFTRYSTLELERQQQGVKPEKDDVIELLRYLIPTKPHLATSVILDVNIIMCLLMILSGVHILYPNVLELMPWGANRRYETMHGESWRIVSSMFVHAGVIHLIFNIYGLVIAGSFLETLIGAKKYTLIYLGSGLIASVASIMWHPDTASIGASGAIFGLFGAILSFLVTGMYIVKEQRRTVLLLFGPYVGINLLFGLASAGIDNAAHIGGLIAGFAAGLIFYLTSDKYESEAL